MANPKEIQFKKDAARVSFDEKHRKTIRFNMGKYYAAVAKALRGTKIGKLPVIRRRLSNGTRSNIFRNICSNSRRILPEMVALCFGHALPRMR